METDLLHGIPGRWTPAHAVHQAAGIFLESAVLSSAASFPEIETIEQSEGRDLSYRQGISANSRRHKLCPFVRGHNADCCVE
jgi:hypothetical protein